MEFLLNSSPIPLFGGIDLHGLIDHLLNGHYFKIVPFQRICLTYELLLTLFRVNHIPIRYGLNFYRSIVSFTLWPGLTSLLITVAVLRRINVYHLFLPLRNQLLSKKISGTLNQTFALPTLHHQYKHTGTSMLMAILAEEYYIPGVKAFKKTDYSCQCVTCQWASPEKMVW